MSDTTEHRADQGAQNMASDKGHKSGPSKLPLDDSATRHKYGGLVIFEVDNETQALYDLILKRVNDTVAQHGAPVNPNAQMLRELANLFEEMPWLEIHVLMYK